MLVKLLSIFALLNLVKGFNVSFWIITDIHLNLTADASAAFGDYQQDSQIALVRSAIATMRKKHAKPDFVIWNGDNAAHLNLTNSAFFKSIRTVTQEMERAFRKTELLPSVGNHDVNPRNNLNPHSSWCTLMLEEWTDLIHGTEEVTSFKRGCYYSRLVSAKLRVIILNTVLWMMANKYTQTGEDPANQFQWLIKQLENSRKLGEKVFLVGHVPPGASEFSPIKYVHLHAQYNEKFVDILEKYSDIIEAGLFSHEHVDAFRVVYNGKAEAKFPLLLSPSVSPLYLYNLGSPNPSIRFYKWSSNASSYKQYHAIIPKSSASLSWTELYNSTSITPSLSGSDMHDLLKSFAHNNSKSYSTFLQHHLSGRQHDIDCSIYLSRCYCLLMCGLHHLRHDTLKSCTSNCSVTINTVTPTTAYSTESMLLGSTSIIHNATYIEPPSTESISSKTQIMLIAIIIVVFTLILMVIVFCANKIYCKQRRTASLTRDMHMASYNGKEAQEIMEEHIDNIVESTFADVPEYRGHFRQNSRTLLTPKDAEDFAMAKQKKAALAAANSKPDVIIGMSAGISNAAALDTSSNNGPGVTLSKFILNPKSHEKYEYQRM